MNWEDIKKVYRSVLIRNCKIEYLGNGNFRISMIVHGIRLWSYTLKSK